jgi:hypothetical protein
MTRTCTQCGREVAVSVVSFPLLREGYPMGALCHASWRRTAEALGSHLGNPAKVLVAFRRWQEARPCS